MKIRSHKEMTLLLKKEGFSIHANKKHEVWRHSDGRTVVAPRKHRHFNEIGAKQILKQAGINI